ncbi:MAG: hypothetical protein HIU89_09300 [Proteobacteria bacterium]|nr:hypothetical protein [Pseudomonadota bacterium]
MTRIPGIISGGAGSRLWPVSRDGHPQPVARAVARAGGSAPYTVTKGDLFVKTEDGRWDVNSASPATTFRASPSAVTRLAPCPRWHFIGEEVRARPTLPQATQRSKKEKGQA